MSTAEEALAAFRSGRPAATQPPRSAAEALAAHRNARFAPGGSPENPIDDMPPSMDVPTRHEVQYVSPTPEAAAQNFKAKGFEAVPRDGWNISVRDPKNGKWYVVDPSRPEWADIGDIAGEVTDIGAGTLAAIPATAKGVGVGTGVAGPVGGFVGGIVAGGAAAGAGMAASRTARAEGGRLLGYNKAAGKETLRGAGSAFVEGALGEAIGQPLGKVVTNLPKILKAPLKGEERTRGWLTDMTDRALGGPGRRAAEKAASDEAAAKARAEGQAAIDAILARKVRKAETGYGMARASRETGGLGKDIADLREEVRKLNQTAQGLPKNERAQIYEQINPLKDRIAELQRLQRETRYRASLGREAAAGENVAQARADAGAVLPPKTTEATTANPTQAPISAPPGGSVDDVDALHQSLMEALQGKAEAGQRQRQVWQEANRHIRNTWNSPEMDPDSKRILVGEFGDKAKEASDRLAQDASRAVASAEKAYYDAQVKKLAHLGDDVARQRAEAALSTAKREAELATPPIPDTPPVTSMAGQATAQGLEQVAGKVASKTAAHLESEMAGTTAFGLAGYAMNPGWGGFMTGMAARYGIRGAAILGQLLEDAPTKVKMLVSKAPPRIRAIFEKAFSQLRLKGPAAYRAAMQAIVQDPEVKEWAEETSDSLLSQEA